MQFVIINIYIILTMDIYFTRSIKIYLVYRILVVMMTSVKMWYQSLIFNESRNIEMPNYKIVFMKKKSSKITYTEII